MINELIQKGKEKDIEIEVFNINEEDWWIETFNNKVIKYNISNERKYDIKALYKNKNIYLTTNNLDDLEFIISKILYLYELSDNTDLSEFAKRVNIKEKENKKIILDPKKISKFLINLNSLKKVYTELKTISAGFNYTSEDIVIKNKDTELIDNTKQINVGIEIVIKKNKKTETNYLNIYTDEFNEENITNKVKLLIQETIEKLRAKSIKTFNTNVLLTNEMSFLILKTFASMFYGKNIRLGTSVLTDKFNQKVFSDKLTIVEDPSSTSMIVSRLFDNEGTKTYYKEIVKEGIFCTKLYSNKEARLDKKESTGNSYGVRNMYIIPGNNSFRDLVKTIKKGIIIDDIQGLHSGINLVTGNFSVQCSGYKIENGEVSEPIKMFVMSSNIIDLYNNIIEVGNDLEFFEPFGGSPSLLIKNVNIAGSEK